jgi:hypothetical protein
MNYAGTKTALFAAALGCAAAAEACTSWIIHPSCAKDGRMIVQKCRDSKPSPLAADIRTAPDGRRWMRIGTGDHYATFAMNDRGIVATMNDGDDLTVKHRGGEYLGVGTGNMLHKIMCDADSACAGALMVLDYGRNGRRSGRGGTLFVADAKRAFMIDVGPGYGEMKELTGGMVVISNCLHLPGVEEISRQKVGALRGDRSREANVRAALKAEKVDGKYTPRGTIKVSRMKCGKAMKDKYPFRKNSLGGVCFEIDGEFPAYLSTAYVALGPQQHTVYLPCPMALRQFPEAIRNGKWADISYKFREKAGDDHKLVGELFDFEDKLIPEYEKVREEARALLRAGKNAEAEKLLNDTFARHFEAAEALLTQLYEKSEVNPDSYNNSCF